MAGSTTYRSQFPQKIYAGNCQAERSLSASNPRIAGARDYNTHDIEIIRIQQVMGTGTLPATMTSMLLDALGGDSDIDIADVVADDFIAANPLTPCGSAWGLGATPTLQDLLEKALFGTGVLDFNKLCNQPFIPSSASGVLQVDHDDPVTAGSSVIDVVGGGTAIPADLGQPLTAGFLFGTTEWAGLNARPFSGDALGGWPDGDPPGLYSRSDQPVGLGRIWWILAGPHGIMAAEDANPYVAGGSFTINEGMLQGAVPFYHYDSPLPRQDWARPLHFRFESHAVEGSSVPGTGLVDVNDALPGRAYSASLVLADLASNTPKAELAVDNGEYTPWFLYPFDWDAANPDTWDIPPSIQLLQFPGGAQFRPGQIILPTGVIQAPTGIFQNLEGIDDLHMNASGVIRFCDLGRRITNQRLGDSDSGLGGAWPEAFIDCLTARLIKGPPSGTGTGVVDLHMHPTGIIHWCDDGPRIEPTGVIGGEQGLDFNIPEFGAGEDSIPPPVFTPTSLRINMHRPLNMTGNQQPSPVTISASDDKVLWTAIRGKPVIALQITGGSPQDLLGVDGIENMDIGDVVTFVGPVGANVVNIQGDDVGPNDFKVPGGVSPLTLSSRFDNATFELKEDEFFTRRLVCIHSQTF